MGSCTIKAQRRQLETVTVESTGAHFLRPHLALAPHQLLVWLISSVTHYPGLSFKYS